MSNVLQCRWRNTLRCYVESDSGFVLSLRNVKPLLSAQRHRYILTHTVGFLPVLVRFVEKVCRTSCGKYVHTCGCFGGERYVCTAPKLIITRSPRRARLDRLYDYCTTRHTGRTLKKANKVMHVSENCLPVTLPPSLPVNETPPKFRRRLLYI